MGLCHKKNGILHLIDPKNRITLPRATITCEDYNNSNHETFGAIAFEQKAEAIAIRNVVNKSLEQGIVTEDLAPKGSKAYKTSEVGDWLVANL